MENNDAQQHVFRSPFLNSIATFHTLSLFHQPNERLSLLPIFDQQCINNVRELYLFALSSKSNALTISFCLIDF